MLLLFGPLPLCRCFSRCPFLWGRFLILVIVERLLYQQVLLQHLVYPFAIVVVEGFPFQGTCQRLPSCEHVSRWPTNCAASQWASM